mmetsp:Transcript_125818/g.402777  ORF Transcript_125818/g.402777 Transcript_125818/m.402777 type:complete len:486 (+) Transcript_125818:60-1517(+)
MACEHLGSAPTLADDLLGDLRQGSASACEGDAAGERSPSSKWQHPPSFYCPISQQCMHDPVVLADGHSYERRYIERWLQHHSTSPVSGVLLPQTDMFPNHALRNAIEEYFQQVFSVHRRAIRQSLQGPDAAPGFVCNAPLLRTIDALMQCSLLMNADLSIERVLRRIMDEAKTLVGAEVASVFLLDTDKQELYSTVNSTGIAIHLPVTHGIAGHVATTGEPVVIEDAYSDGRFNKAVDAKTGFKTRNIMCVPLKAKKGGVIGVVQLINKSGPAAFSTDPTSSADDDRSGASGPAFTRDDLQFLLVFASQAATAIANSRADDTSDDLHQGSIGECGPAENQEVDPTKSEGWVVDCSVSECAGGDGRIDDGRIVADGAHVGGAASEAAAARSVRSRRGSAGAGSSAAEAVPQQVGQSASSRVTFEAHTPREVEEDGLGQATSEGELAEASKRRSGRARQRAAKYWAKVRCRTPSPDSGSLVGCAQLF